MKPSRRITSRVPLCAAAALAVLAVSSCSTEPAQSPVKAPADQAPSKFISQGASASGSTAIQPEKTDVEKQKPVRKEKPELAEKDEKSQIDKLVKLVPAEGSIRVMIRLESDAFPEIKAPVYDSRAKRGDIELNRQRERNPRGPVEVAQTRFLQKFEQTETRSIIVFERAPYLAMNLNRTDAASLRNWIHEIQPGTPQRPFKIWVEKDIGLKTQSAPALQSSSSVDEAIKHMDFGTITPVAAPSTVVIIDDRINDKLSLLQGRIDALQSIAWNGVVTNEPVSATASNPTDYSAYTPTHATKLALLVAKAAPNARIIGIDVFGTSAETDVGLIVKALQTVLTQWAEDPSRKVAAVCVSIGFPEWASTGACDCPANAVDPLIGCTVLKLALRDHVNMLADPEVQIPVIIAAGNHSTYNGEVYFPSCLTTAVTVGATESPTTAVARSLGSNWGPMLNLCAQGTDLKMQLDSPLADPFAAARFTGSSFAVPFVASAFSVLLDLHPDASQALIDEALRKNGHPIPDPATGVTVPEIRLQKASTWLKTPPAADPTPVATTIVNPQPPPPGPN